MREPAAFLTLFAPHASQTTQSQNPSVPVSTQTPVTNPPLVSQTALSTVLTPLPSVPGGSLSFHEQQSALHTRSPSPSSMTYSSNSSSLSSTQSTLSSGYSSDSRSLISQNSGTTYTNSSTRESRESFIPNSQGVSTFAPDISVPSAQSASNIDSSLSPFPNNAASIQSSGSPETAPAPGAEGALRGICRHCGHRESDCVLLPCGHLALCSSCVLLPTAALCPVCRAPVRSVVRTFLA